LTTEFRDSPHLFGQALIIDIFDCHYPEATFLQYVDDLPLCRATEPIICRATESLFKISGLLREIICPMSSQWKVLKTLHQTYHSGNHKTLSLAGQLFEGIKHRYTLQDLIRGCEICQHNNPCKLPCLSLELRGRGHIQGSTGNLTSPTCQEAQPLD
jgi:hypothetical protein